MCLLPLLLKYRVVCGLTKGAAEVIVIEVFLFTVLYPEILHML